MPNWTYNKIVMRDKASFLAVCETMKSNESDFDFNRIIEQPKALDKIRSCGSEYDAIQMVNVICRDLGHADLEFGEVASWLKDHYPRLNITDKNRVHPVFGGIMPAYTISIEEIDLLAKMSFTKNHMRPTKLLEPEVCRQMLDARIKLGTCSWYEWRIANWGVKWNAGDISIDNYEMSISFSTPWSPVIDLMSQLSELVGVELYYMFDEEQIEVCCGELWFDHGECLIENCTGEFDETLFLVAAEINDPCQDDMRWDGSPGAGYVVYRYDTDSDEFDKLPVLSLGTTLKEDFLANNKPGAML